MTKTRSNERKLTKPDYERLAQFRHLLRRFLLFSERAATAMGLTPQQHQAILAIKGFPDRERVSIADLAKRLGIRHHSAVGLVDRLIEHALVRRRSNVDDRRQVIVELTPKAERLLLQLSRIHWDEIRRLAPLLSALLGQLEKEGG